MADVRNKALKTITLIVLIVAVIVLTGYMRTAPGDVIYRIKYLLSTKALIGSFHRMLVTVSFWLILIASFVDSIFRQNRLTVTIGSFVPIVIFTVCIAIVASIMAYKGYRIVIFWMIYYLALIIFNRALNSRLSWNKGAGPKKINDFLKSRPSTNGPDVSAVDRYVLYTYKLVLLIDFFALLISLIIFCINNKYIFGL